MNWTGSVNTSARFKQSKDKQAQKEFFRRQRTSRVRNAYRESNAMLSATGTLARAMHITESNQIGIQHQPRFKSIHQKVNEFQKAVLIQKFQQVNAQTYDSTTLQHADKLLAEASRLSSSLSTDHYAYHLSSTSFPIDPLFDLETNTSGSSLSGHTNYEKEHSGFFKAAYQNEGLVHAHISHLKDGIGVPADTKKDARLKTATTAETGPANWSQWLQNRHSQNDHSSDINDDLASLNTSQSNERFPVSLSVSSLDESSVFCSL